MTPPLHRKLSDRGRLVVAMTVAAVVFLAAAALIMVPSRYGFGAEILPSVPDPRLTPGVVASTDPAVVCATGADTYSEQHRRTADSLKRAVYAGYKISPAGRDFEIDHRLPLALGGADVVANLWPQRGWIHPSYHDKDLLEGLVWRLVCKKHTMTLAAGRAIFLGDWTLGFTRLYGRPPQ